jgi:hypothetical protein
MRVVSRIPSRIAGALLLNLIISACAHAAAITLTGGDSGEGYAPLASTFAALNVGNNSSFTVQGVNFAGTDPNIALSSVTPTTNNVVNLGASANDVSLQSVFASSVFAVPGPITVTISGLTLGQEYQLDFFLGFQGAGRTMQSVLRA